MKGIPPTEFPNRMTPVANKIYLYTGSNFKAPDLPPIPIPPQISVRKEAEAKVENSKAANQPNHSKVNTSSNSQEERKQISSMNNGSNSFLSLYSFYFEPIQVKVDLHCYNE